MRRTGPWRTTRARGLVRVQNADIYDDIDSVIGALAALIEADA